MKMNICESTLSASRPRLGTQFCKRLLAFLASSFLALTAWCATGTWLADGVAWHFTYSGSTAIITGADYYRDRLNVPAKVYVGSTPYDVTEIGDDAFDFAVDPKVTSITDIVIPPSVKIIGNYAFAGCSGLTSLQLGYNPKSPTGVQEIKYGAFQDDINLERVEIPRPVSSISDDAFAGCSALETVTFEQTVHNITMDPHSVFADTPFLTHVNDNDNWKDAIALTGNSGSTSGCNILATQEPGEPLGFHSLWWKWTAPAGVKKAAFHTYGSSFRTKLGVYKGSAVDVLTPVVVGDNRLSDATSFVQFVAEPGQTYYICVTGVNNLWYGTVNLGWMATGGFSLVVQDDALLGFIGDCPASVTIPGEVSVIEKNAFAYNLDPSVENLTSVKISGSAVRIEEFAFWSCINLSSVVFENPEASVEINNPASAFYGTPYLNSLTGNDYFSSAVEITGASGTVMGWNGNATTQSGEPFISQGDYRHTMWWKWRAPAGVKKAVFHTYGCAFDTALGVYTGTAFPLTEVGFNDDYSAIWTGDKSENSLVSFDVTPGTTYYICVAGYEDNTGVVRLGWNATGGFSLLTWNETLLGFLGECPESLTIPGTVTEIMLSAFDHDNFPNVANLKSVVIPESVESIGDYAFRNCAKLQTVTFEGDPLEIDMDPGLVFLGTPFLAAVNANNFFADAIELTGAKGSTTAWNAFATTEADEPEDTECHSLWWKWKAPAGVTKAAFYTSGSAFDTVLGVYQGTAVDALTDVAFNDDHGDGSFVSFDVTPGTTYYICVAGFSEDDGGSVKLTWETANGFALVIDDGIVRGFLGDCPESVTIPTTVTEIGECAFDASLVPSAANLKKIDIPGNVTAIRCEAFYDCVNLASVTFNEGLEEIEVCAFEGCSGLKGQTLILPTTMKDVDEDAFFGIGGKLTLMLPRSLNGLLVSGASGTTELTVGYYVRVTLDPNGGTLAEKDRVRMLTGETFGDLAPLPTRTGYTFKGWKLGNTAITATTALPNVATLTLTAQWEIIKNTVTLDLGGGTGTDSLTVTYGTKVGDIPKPTRDNYEFIGWFTAATGGVEVPANTPITGNLKLFAQWKAIFYLYSDANGAVPLTAASKYEGYLYKEKGKAVGSIEVKLSKPKKNKRFAGTPFTTKPTITITIPGEGKVLVKGMDILADSIVIEGSLGKRALYLKIGANGMAGTFGEFGIEGARNLFTSKNRAEVAAANAVFDRWRGAISFVTDQGAFSVSLSAKGKATLSGTVNGKKLSSVKGQVLVGEEWCCLPLVWSKNGTRGSYTLWLKHDGSRAAVAESESFLVGKPGSLARGAQFTIDDVPALVGLVPGIFTDLLPTNVTVTTVGTKWVLPKAGKVAFMRGTMLIDTTKLGANPSALKLTYKAKDGSFKGSFKVYAIIAGRLKYATVNVSGALINGVGHGTATIRGVSGSVPVTVK